MAKPDINRISISDTDHLLHKEGGRSFERPDAPDAPVSGVQEVYEMWGSRRAETRPEIINLVD